MTIALPTLPAPVQLKPSMIRAGNDLPSPLTLYTQRLNRLGDRYSFQCIMPPMTRDVGDLWVTRLLGGFYDVVIFAYPQPLIGVGSPGSPVANGTSAGTTFNVKGLTPGYVFKEGQFISFTHNGLGYLHKVTADATADGSGHVALGMMPPMRVSTSDGDTVHVTQPLFEALVGGDAASWNIDVAQTIGLSFTLNEAQ